MTVEFDLDVQVSPFSDVNIVPLDPTARKFTAPEFVVNPLVDPDAEFSIKFAVNVRFWDTEIVLLCSVEPSDQLVNSYPAFGVAVNVTWVPWSYEPPPETEPPEFAVNVTE